VSRATEVQATPIETRLPFPAVGGWAPFMRFESSHPLRSCEANAYYLPIRSNYVKENLFGSFMPLIHIISFFLQFFLNLSQIFIHTRMALS
jgi:hypothetical protein